MHGSPVDGHRRFRRSTLMNTRRLITAALALLGLVLGVGRGRAANPITSFEPRPRRDRNAEWDVYALRYATVKAFPVHELVTGADTTRTTDIAMTVWLLQGPSGHRVLLDAGFYRQKFLDSWKPAEFVKPSDAVSAAGVPADSITDVIVSHVHWDHLDGADLFPNATIWIQREEYEHHVGADGQPLAGAIDTVDAAMLAAMRKAGRVQLVQGDSQMVLPGIIAFTGGKHTYASQYLTVQTAKGMAVLASDNLYLYENLEEHRPI